MKRYLLILIALIVLLSAAVAGGAAQIGASGYKLQYSLETLCGDPSAANGLEISGVKSGFQYSDGSTNRLMYCWTSSLGIEDGDLKLRSVDVNKTTGIMEYYAQSAAPELTKRDVSAEDRNGSFVYRCFYRDSNYYLEVTDKKSGKVTFSSKVEYGFENYTYPVLFAGRGSAVLCFAQNDPNVAVYRSYFFDTFALCVTADGELIELPEYTYRFADSVFYPVGGSSFVSVSSLGNRFAIVKRSLYRTEYDEKDEFVSNREASNSPEIWVFGPEGLEFMGICNCNLDERQTHVTETRGQIHSISWYDPMIFLKMEMQLTW